MHCSGARGSRFHAKTLTWMNFLPGAAAYSFAYAHPGSQREPFHAGTDTAMAQDNVQIAEEEEERIPAMQHLLDNPFLLLFLGVAIPAVLYILWGVMEIVTLPNVPQ